MFREVSMVEVKEVLRQRQQGRFLREIARGVGLDRKTIRRYLEVAVSAGFDPKGSEVSDEIVSAVVAQPRPSRPGGVGRGETWLELEGQHAFLTSRWTRCRSPAATARQVRSHSESLASGRPSSAAADGGQGDGPAVGPRSVRLGPHVASPAPRANGPTRGSTKGPGSASVALVDGPEDTITPLRPRSHPAQPLGSGPRGVRPAASPRRRP
jgi:hypothetical protein